LANNSAQARPMPVPPPVMNATFSESRSTVDAPSVV
jgi:hypothetical protein